MTDFQFSFSQHLQDSLLYLAIMDDEVVRYVSTMVTPENFILDLAQIVCRIVQDFYRKYEIAPKEHFGDLVEEEIKKGRIPESKVNLFLDYALRLHEISPNKDYVLSNLSQFVKHTNIITGIVKGAQLVEKGQYEKAENTLIEAFQSGIKRGDLGIDYFNDLDARATPLDIICETQIEALDEKIGGLSRGEMVILLAPTSRGKSWGLIHIAKVALMQKLKVLYYTLEMSPEWTATRIDMGLAGMSTRAKDIWLPSGENIKVKSVFDNKKEVINTTNFVKTIGGRLIIKGIPKGGLTLHKLRTDLELLEVTHKITPDIVIIDYGDLMTPETSYSEFRHNLTGIYQGLRSIAVEKNVLMVTASQSNRGSASAKIVSLEHFAEDIQKANIADMVLSICQTPEEAKESKFRIFVCKNRNDVKGFQIENYYSYHIGQFSLLSRLYED